MGTDHPTRRHIVEDDEHTSHHAPRQHLWSETIYIPTMTRVHRLRRCDCSVLFSTPLRPYGHNGAIFVHPLRGCHTTTVTLSHPVMTPHPAWSETIYTSTMKPHPAWSETMTVYNPTMKPDRADWWGLPDLSRRPAWSKTMNIYIPAQTAVTSSKTMNTKNNANQIHKKSLRPHGRRLLLVYSNLPKHFYLLDICLLFCCTI